MSWWKFLLVWYSIPGIATMIAVWWKTEIIIGSRSAYWQERRDIAWIAKCLAVYALWPVAGVSVAIDVWIRHRPTSASANQQNGGG